MNAKKLIILVVVAFVLFYIVTQPGQSAGAVHTMLGWLRTWAEAIITFVKNLFE